MQQHTLWYMLVIIYQAASIYARTTRGVEQISVGLNMFHGSYYPQS